MKKYISIILLLSVCISFTSCALIDKNQEDNVYGTYNVSFDPNKISKLLAPAIDFTLTSDIIDSLKFESVLDLELTLKENGTFEIQLPVLGFNNYVNGLRNSVRAYLTNGGLYTIMETLYKMDKKTVDKNIASHNKTFDEAVDEIVSSIDMLKVRNEAFTSLSEMFGGISFKQKDDKFIACGKLEVFDDGCLTIDEMMNFKYDSGTLTLTSYNTEEYMESLLSDSYFAPNDSNSDVSYFNSSVSIVKFVPDN